MKSLRTEVREHFAEQTFSTDDKSGPRAEAVFRFAGEPTHKLAVVGDSSFWATVEITKFGKRSSTLRISSVDKKQLLELAANLITIADQMVFVGSDNVEYFSDVKLDIDSNGEIFVDGFFEGSQDKSVLIATVKPSGEVVMGAESRIEYLSSPRVEEALAKALAKNAQMFY
ncbi:MAG: hypothetical protein IM613_17175 [Cytophagales bacterium]|nr:hypothetical protein [Cytophagales bacterium]